jgi:hypothetical protein
MFGRPLAQRLRQALEVVDLEKGERGDPAYGEVVEDGCQIVKRDENLLVTREHSAIADFENEQGSSGTLKENRWKHE